MEGKLDNTQKVVYVAELDQDIDDIIANKGKELMEL